MKTVLLDMDGVLCDFHTAFMHFTHWDPNKDSFSDSVIKWRIFERLETLKNAEKLIGLLVDYNCEINILSSLGTWDIKIANVAKEQKLNWLKANKIAYSNAYFVNDWSEKHKFGNHHTLMIDDLPPVIKSFEDRGLDAQLYDDSKWDEISTLLLTKLEKRNNYLLSSIFRINR